MKARFKYRIYPTPGQKYRERKAIWLCSCGE
ncbi:helix-turn-helix domain-containing protein [Okeania sp. SIO3B5]|nr:helix-turn-helix domain-containing protein [Okeania sp. SIO3B5]